MNSFRLKLTNKGIELLAAILDGDNVQFTKIKMGDGVEPSNFMTLTNLVNTRQTLNIARKGKEYADIRK